MPPSAVHPPRRDPSEAPVVVLGATGFVGRHVVAALAAAGDGREIFGVARRAPAEALAGCRLQPLDVERETARLAELVPAGAAVVQLLDLGAAAGGEGEGAAVDAACRLLDACARAGAARLVHIGTAAVAGLAGGGTLDESAPCRPADAYQRRKLAVEETLRREAPAGLDLVVLRPTAVFGEGGRNLASLAASLAGSRPGGRASARRAACWTRSALFARRSMNLVPVETVAAAVRWAIERPEPHGGAVYLVSADDEPGNTFRPVERALMAGLGVPDYRLTPPPLPPALLALVLRAAGRLRLPPTVRFSPARLRSRGFTPPLPLAEALERYARRVGAAAAGPA